MRAGKVALLRRAVWQMSNLSILNVLPICQDGFLLSILFSCPRLALFDAPLRHVHDKSARFAPFTGSNPGP
jgi:hypothetical protein